MATLELHSEVFARYNAKIKEANEAKILNDEYIQKFGSLYSHEKVTFYRGNSASLDLANAVPDDKLEEMEAHIVFLDSLLKLKQAIDDPANNPREISEISNSKDRDAKKTALQLIPNLKKMLTQAVKAIEVSYFDPYSHGGGYGITSGERLDTLAFITTSLNDTTILVNEITKPTDKDKCQKMQKLLNDTQAITKGKIAKICLKNPMLTAFVASLITTAAIFTAIGGLMACCFPGGLVAGLPMLAASAALVWMASKIMDISHTRNDQKSRTKGELAEYADALTKFINSDKTFKAFEKSEAALKKAAKLPTPKIATKHVPEERRPIVPRRSV
jgi:hypothetical protein